jgi:O-antigen/teichoic acid export membrane protein
MSRPALVVAAWGAVNGALVAVFAGFGAKWAPLALYASAAFLVELVAVAVWLGQGRRRTGWPQRPNGDSIPLFALTVLIVGLGVVFYWQLAPVAIIPLFFAITREATGRSNRA